MAKFCKECTYWLFVYESSGKKFGVCDHPSVEDKVVLEKEYDGEIAIYTESLFGCIYHSPLHGNIVTKLPKQ